MKLVIELPDDFLENVIGLNKNFDAIKEAFYGSMAIMAIQNGTPLPDGHGDLIDRDVLIECADADYEDGEFYAVSVREIKYAEAVIPADRSGE